MVADAPCVVIHLGFSPRPPQKYHLRATQPETASAFGRIARNSATENQTKQGGIARSILEKTTTNEVGASRKDEIGSLHGQGIPRSASKGRSDGKSAPDPS